MCCGEEHYQDEVGYVCCDDYGKNKQSYPSDFASHVHIKMAEGDLACLILTEASDLRQNDIYRTDPNIYSHISYPEMWTSKRAELYFTPTDKQRELLYKVPDDEFVVMYANSNFSSHLHHRTIYPEFWGLPWQTALSRLMEGAMHEECKECSSVLTYEEWLQKNTMIGRKNA